MEGFAEFGQRPDECAAGAEEFLSVEGIVDLYAPFRAVAILLDDHLAEIADAKHDAREAGLFQETKLVREKWLACDLDEELRDFFGDRAQARGEAAGKEGDGKIGGSHRRS
jgi:hypothetical protein